MVRACAGSSDVIPLLSLYRKTVLFECEFFRPQDEKRTTKIRNQGVKRISTNIGCANTLEREKQSHWLCCGNGLLCWHALKTIEMVRDA